MSTCIHIYAHLSIAFLDFEVIVLIFSFYFSAPTSNLAFFFLLSLVALSFFVN